MLRRADDASWFEWNGGSALVFWRWHDFAREARDGFVTHFLNNGLRKTGKKACPPSMPRDEEVEKLINEKLNKILRLRYISDGYVHWDIAFFEVPKGEEDIRIAYHGKKNGINDLVWMPTFALLTSASLGRLLEPRTYQMDMDICDMFHNFMLHKDVRAYCGVNVTGLELEAAETNRNRWDRLWMGFKPSPHNAARHLAIATEFALGDPLDETNAFFWDKLILNLPCAKSFDPAMLGANIQAIHYATAIFSLYA